MRLHFPRLYAMSLQAEPQSFVLIAPPTATARPLCLFAKISMRPVQIAPGIQMRHLITMLTAQRALSLVMLHVRNMIRRLPTHLQWQRRLILQL
jgi:hypothetical protein